MSHAWLDPCLWFYYLFVDFWTVYHWIALSVIFGGFPESRHGEIVKFAVCFGILSWILLNVHVLSDLYVFECSLGDQVEKDWTVRAINSCRGVFIFLFYGDFLQRLMHAGVPAKNRLKERFLNWERPEELSRLSAVKESAISFFFPNCEKVW